jgi:hypothetical protein
VNDDQLRERFAQILISKLDREHYPSATTMALLDRMPGRVRAAYVSVLLDKIEEDQYPSPDLMHRLMGLLAA